ncbi:COX assembly mitochondrial protein homolog [Molossus nigricans]
MGDFRPRRELGSNVSPSQGPARQNTGRTRWASVLKSILENVSLRRQFREKARERCSEQVQEFTKCCQESGILMVVKCRKENSAFKECLTSYYMDPAFYEECKMEYLKKREEHRKTGIPTKKRLQKLPTSM